LATNYVVGIKAVATSFANRNIVLFTKLQSNYLPIIPPEVIELLQTKEVPRARYELLKK